MKVTLHKSTDGELHSTAKECAKRNIELRVRAIAEKTTFNLERFDQSDDIRTFIADNHEVLRKILTESLIVRRPRKPKLQVGMVVAA